MPADAVDESEYHEVKIPAPPADSRVEAMPHRTALVAAWARSAFASMPRGMRTQIAIGVVRLTIQPTIQGGTNGFSVTVNNPLAAQPHGHREAIYDVGPTALQEAAGLLIGAADALPASRDDDEIAF